MPVLPKPTKRLTREQQIVTVIEIGGRGMVCSVVRGGDYVVVGCRDGTLIELHAKKLVITREL